MKHPIWYVDEFCWAVAIWFLTFSEYLIDDFAKFVFVTCLWKKMVTCPKWDSNRFDEFMNGLKISKLCTYICVFINEYVLI